MKCMMKFGLCLSLLSLGRGCGGDEDEGPDSDDLLLNEEGCFHMKKAEDALMVEAGLEFEDAVDVTAEHRRVDIKLAAPEAGSEIRSGYVRYDAAESGDYIIYSSSAAPLSLFSSQEMAIVFKEQNEPVAACTEVALRHEAEFQAGASYVIYIGPTDVETVSFVIEHEEGHDHDDD